MFKIVFIILIKLLINLIETTIIYDRVGTLFPYPFYTGCIREDDFSPDKFDKTKFYRCDHGFQFAFKCAPGTVFDSNIKVCVHSNEMMRFKWPQDRTYYTILSHSTKKQEISHSLKLSVVNESLKKIETTKVYKTIPERVLSNNKNLTNKIELIYTNKEITDIAKTPNKQLTFVSTQSNRKATPEKALFWLANKRNVQNQTNLTNLSQEMSNITKLANTKFSPVVTPSNHKTTPEKALIWLANKRDVQNQTSISLNITKIANTTPSWISLKLNSSNISRPRSRKPGFLRQHSLSNETETSKSQVSNIMRPLNRKLNRLIHLMKFIKNSLPLKAKNSTGF